MRKKILILCTGNSCRSHMAEGWLRHVADDLFEVFSAGSDPAGYVHPLAIEAMNEVGVDLSEHHSKHQDEFLESGIDVVVTVCSNAEKNCEDFLASAERHHWGFEDPPKAVREDETEADAFRRIRNDIQQSFSAYAADCRQALG